MHACPKLPCQPAYFVQPTGVPLVDELMKLGSVEAAAQRRCAASLSVERNTF